MIESLFKLFCSLTTDVGSSSGAILIVLAAWAGTLVAFVLALRVQIAEKAVVPRLLFARLASNLLLASVISLAFIPALVRHEFSIPAAFIIGLSSHRVIESLIGSMTKATKGETMKDEMTSKDKK